MPENLRHLSAMVAFAALLALPGLASADKFAGEFMALGAGARPLGMGGAFTAVSDDASSVYYNPAGMSGFVKREVLFMHARQFGDFVKYNFLSYVNPTTAFVADEREASWGIALIHLGVDDIIITNQLPFVDVDGDGKFEPEDGDRVPFDLSTLPRESENNFALFGSYALATSFGRVGGTLKLIYQNSVTGLSSTGIGIDLGWLMRDVLPDFDVGVKLQDITGTYLAWSTGTNEFIAPSVRVGLAYTVVSTGMNGSVLLVTDGAFYFEDRRQASQFWAGRYSMDLFLGLEMRFQEKVMVRGGFERENPTVGAGFELRFFTFDYAFLHHDELEESHRISVGARF